MNPKSLFKTLRILGLLEGISYLSFIVTVPLKHFYDIKLPNKIVGQLHGILFIAFVLFVFLASRVAKWNVTTQILAYLSSLIPLGTFFADAKIFAPSQKMVE